MNTDRDATLYGEQIYRSWDYSFLALHDVVKEEKEVKKAADVTPRNGGE